MIYVCISRTWRQVRFLALVRAGYEVGVEPSSRSVDIWEHRRCGGRDHRKQGCELGVGGGYVVNRHSGWVLVRAGGAAGTWVVAFMRIAAS